MPEIHDFSVDAPEIYAVEKCLLNPAATERFVHPTKHPSSAGGLLFASFNEHALYAKNLIFRCVLASLYEVVPDGRMDGWSVGRSVNPLFLNAENEPTLTLLNVLGVLGVLDLLDVLNVLHVRNMLMDASLASWALFSICHRNNFT